MQPVCGWSGRFFNCIIKPRLANVGLHVGPAGPAARLLAAPGAHAVLGDRRAETLNPEKFVGS